MDMQSYHTEKRRKRVKLIFNPKSGSSNDSPVQLMNIINTLQTWKLIPEVYLLQPDSDLQKMVTEALAGGIHLFIACGGDGTISAVAKAITGLPATLGIIPTGTQNNIAHSLNIPADIADAVSVFRLGRRAKIDMGSVTCGEIRTPFLEICSVGLMSSLFPAADEIQHGHVEKIGDFLSTLVSCSPSAIRLLLEGKQEISKTGHVVLISNMPYVGRHFCVGEANAFKDGLLDVLLFSDLTKMDLLGCAIKGADVNELNDHRIECFHVRQLEIDTDPAMSVMVDGNMVGEGRIQIEVNHSSLAVLLKAPVREKPEVKTE